MPYSAPGPFLGAQSTSTAYQVSRSLRFRSSASAYLSRTFGTPTNQKKFTYSFWAKLGSFGTNNAILLGACTNTSNNDSYIIISSNILTIGSYQGAGTDYGIKTAAVLRDYSAWYHCVIIFDSANTTSADRAIIYINGVRQTVTNASNGMFPLDHTSLLNSATTHNIARRPTGNDNLYDGYLAEVNFIDGQALTPSSFGQSNALTGVWEPKAYAGSYGTNGFYLPFSDNSGADSFGIGTDNSASALNRVELGNTSVGYTVLGTMTYASGGANVNNLRDNNASTSAADPAGLNTNTALGYDFGRAIKIRKIVTITDNTGSGNANAAVFNIQYSDDNSTWTTVTGSATQHNISSGQGITNSTSIDDNGSHRYWRLKYSSGTTSGNFWIATLDMYVNSIGPNSWYPVNISVTSGTTYDSMIDSPTNYADGGNGRGNYCVLNPLDKSANTTFSNGNLTSTGYNSGGAASFGLTSGKWYWETTLIDPTVGTSNYWGMFGVSSGAPMSYISGYTGFSTGAGVYCTDLSTDGGTYASGSRVTAQTTWANNDVIGLAFDATALTLDVYRNNTKIGSTLTVPAGAIYPSFYQNGSISDTSSSAANFGQRPFTYTPPSGFSALNTQNLPAPALTPSP